MRTQQSEAGDASHIQGEITKVQRRTLATCLALAGLLQVTPGTAHLAPAGAGRSGIPAGQQMTKNAEGVLAVITQSRSTNTLGYRLSIHNDGSAVAEIGAAGSGATASPSRSQQFPPGTVDAATLRRLLDAIGDVSTIPTGFCPKSVSFGTRTEITSAGKTSGDLQCVRPQPSEVNRAPLESSEALAKFVRTTLATLKINDRRFGGNR